MAAEITRRSVLGGLGTGLALILAQSPLASAAIALTGYLGKLDLRLDAITANVLRIGIAPPTPSRPLKNSGLLSIRSPQF